MISIFQDRRWLKNPLDSGRLLLILLGLMGFLQLYVMWPGILTSDSQVQYAQAIAGAYSDHHPPLMSFVWRYLDKIIPGPGLMFGLHLSLLYAAIAFYMRSFRSFKARFLWLLLPLVPHVFIFSNLILKDVGFAFSFLLCAAYLSYCAAEHKKLLFYGMVALGVILLYGTALKFQAYYCAPIVLAWMAYARVQDGVHSKKFMLYFVGLVLVFYSCLHGINHMLVPDAQKNHAWQYVKIYDLAGISARTKASHFPTFSKLPNFSMESFLQQFDNRNHRVDELVMSNAALGHEAILRIGQTPDDRSALYSAWLTTIMKHPVFYLQHRMQNLSHTLLSTPGFTMGPRLIEKIAAPNTIIYNILYGVGRVLSGGVSESEASIETVSKAPPKVSYDSFGYQMLRIFAFLGMSHGVPALLCLAYCILGLRSLGKTWAAVPLLGMNAVGLMMMGVLFFCSMAGTLRYTYVMVCMVHASHLFAYRSYQALRSTKIPL